MASKKAKKTDSRGRKSVKRDSRLSLAGRMKKWFVNIITELKRVIWPDKKKLRQSTVTVLLIIALSVAIILVFDTLITFIMRSTGIYSTKTKPSGPEPFAEGQTGRSHAIPASHLTVDGVRITFGG